MLGIPEPGSYGDFRVLGASETAELFPSLPYGSTVAQGLGSGGFRNSAYYELGANSSPGQSINILRVLADPAAARAPIPPVMAQAVIMETESPYAVPTPQQGGGSLTIPSPDDGVIDGTADLTSASSSPAAAASTVTVAGESIPRWLLVLGLVLLAMLVLKDER